MMDAARPISSLSREFLAKAARRAVEAIGLPAHPPCDGAHRLLWWLLARHPQAMPLHVMLGLNKGIVERLLSGEVEPEDELAGGIEAATTGAVRLADWRWGGPLGWDDQPYARAAA